MWYARNRNLSYPVTTSGCSQYPQINVTIDHHNFLLSQPAGDDQVKLFSGGAGSLLTVKGSAIAQLDSMMVWRFHFCFSVRAANASIPSLISTRMASDRLGMRAE